jgi:hypothetical protein
MAKNEKVEKSVELNIPDFHVEEAKFFLRSTTPLIYNAVAEKAWRELLLPSGRKTAADRAKSLKHDPMTEYRNAVYCHDDRKKTPTRLAFLASAFKQAMAQAALDLPGTRKAEIGRLCWPKTTWVNIWGVPRLFMSIVRSSDMARTPDVRTRAVVDDWCTEITICYMRPKLAIHSINKLMGAAGLTIGVGDWRQGKGGGNYGQFSVCKSSDKFIKHLMEVGGIKAQDEALANPEFEDEQSRRIYGWYVEELSKRKQGGGAIEVEESEETVDFEALIS